MPVACHGLLSRPVEQLIDPGFELMRAVKLEKQLRRPAQVQAFRQFTPDEAGRRRKTFHTLVSLLILSFDHDQDTGRPRIWSQLDRADIDQPDAGIAEFPFQDSFDLLAQRALQPLAMVFLRTPLHFNHLWVKRKRISEKQGPGGGSDAPS